MHESGPDWSFEALFEGDVCGIDEAGRGPLAGPVVAAAVILQKNNIPPGLNDSKKLSEVQRESLFQSICETACVGIGIAEPEEIDRVNILGASMLAMARAATNLSQKPIAALIDGNRAPMLKVPCQTIVKGDAKSGSIAAASIIAKVTRNRMMTDADHRYPGYGFAGHKGYPTQAHRDLLKENGPCPIHRFSYAPVRESLLKHRKSVDINQA